MFYVWYIRDAHGNVVLRGETQRIRPTVLVRDARPIIASATPMNRQR